MSNVELPLKIEILSPRPSGVLPRGRNSPKGADPQRNFRCPDDKWASIAAACALLNMNTAEFCRWTAYAAANEVLRIANEQKVPIPTKTVEIIEKPPETLAPNVPVFNPYGLKK